MHQAIKMIALKTQALIKAVAKQRLPPLVVGDFGISVVRAQLMEHQKKKDQRVGDARQRERTIGRGKQKD